MTRKIKVAVGMSGGVDSSVAAALLQKQGHDVIGIFMKFWSDPKASAKAQNKCCSIDAYEDARRVAKKLDIPLYTMNFKQSFKKFIVDNFIEQYKLGLTPNPCVRCNQFIKFGEFYKKAKALGCDYISTGHYVRLKKTRSGIQLLEGKDQDKDQSYFLFRLNQQILKHCLFPMGDYTKTQTRKIAKQIGLDVFSKKDSQEICFVGEKEHYGFLNRYINSKKGDIIDLQGKKLGTHTGLPNYTIGQRKGLDIGGGGPYYVVDLDTKKNQLIVTTQNTHPALFNDIMYVTDISWIGKAPKLPFKTEARIRYRHKGQKGTLKSIKKNLYSFTFNKKQRAITPGQYAVFYKGKQVLGGGKIIKLKG